MKSETKRLLCMLRASAVGYLRYVRRCDIVCLERSAGYSTFRPDVAGVTRQWRTVEIEIKITVADWRADAEKAITKSREAGYYMPSQFYYLVPREIVETVKAGLRPWQGLMTLNGDQINGVQLACVVSPAPVNASAKPLTPEEMAHMIRHQSGTICSLLRDLERFHAAT